MGIMDLIEGRNAEAQEYLQNPQQHKSKLSHELIAGAAAFEAMKSYENKRKAEGIQGDHSTAREIIAALAGAEVDKMVETRGLDFVDKERAKQQAQDHAVQAYDEQYAGRGR